MKPVRRAQAITPFGVGAMVDFPGPTSLIHAGLDAWPIPEDLALKKEYLIEDSRLAKRLGVDYFILPPDYRERPVSVNQSSGNYYLKLPFLRFPLWHVCPVCGLMHKAKYHHKTAPECRGPYSTGENENRNHEPRKTLQVRFVAACQKGHLQDFPWLEWLRLPDASWRPDGHTRWLRLRSNGNAGADGIEIIAEEHIDGKIRVVQGGKKRLTGALGGEVDSGESPLASVGIKCTGHNPVLSIGEDKASGCGENLYVQLRGASSLYFADIKSSIYIPDVDDSGLSQDILDLLENESFLRELIKHAKSNEEDGLLTDRKAEYQLNESFPELKVDAKELSKAFNKHYLKDILLKDGYAKEALTQLVKINDGKVTAEIIKNVLVDSRTLKFWGIDPKLLVTAIQNWYSQDINQNPDLISENDSEVAYRSDEYKIFCRDHYDGLAKTNLLIKSNSIDEYGSLVQDNFERISLLHKLRETRAFSGFSRIFAKNNIDKHERVGLISEYPTNWLPAIIVRGEGIFLKFRIDKLLAWESQYEDEHRIRLDTVNKNLGDLRKKRHQNEFVVTPRYALLHTFAHILINQLVFDSGYSSASLRERIYCSNTPQGNMAGILIYTAAGDSEGTLGGLVSMGRPGYIEKIISRALEKARWCSTDPICIESKGQGPDSCNLAACHSCVLIPETSCEEQNRLLDRGVMLGSLLRPDLGFFNFSF